MYIISGRVRVIARMNGRATTRGVFKAHSFSFSLILIFLVASAGSENCSGVQVIEPTTEYSVGYLSSSVTAQTGIGSWDCPWVIKADVGQQINVTLLDFTLKGISGGPRCTIPIPVEAFNF